MSEIQATLNFHVQFGNFVNIDLFQRGFYQLRCSVDTSTKASQVEFSNALPGFTTLSKSGNSGRQSQQSASGNANSPNQTQIIFMSKPFLINYKKQEVKVNEAFEFRLHLLVDTDKIEECIDLATYTLNIELWSFSVSPSDPINPDFRDDMLDRMELCCTRSIRLNFVSSIGLFHYIPVFFDYFHLSVVGLTVFGMLLAIHQPYLGFLRQSRNTNAVGKFAEQSTLEAIFFGSPQLPAAVRLQRSLRIHSTICSLLLRSLDSLQQHFDELSALLDPEQFEALDNADRIHCADRLAKLTEILGQLQAEEDVLQMANTQIAQLCAANVVLWSQFVAMARLRPEIELYLATIHAKLRRRRFLEAFLTASLPKRRLLNSSTESRSNSHSARAAIIRQSEYLRSLPVLPLQQIDLDESSALHPIIFEDVYSTEVTEDDMVLQEKQKALTDSLKQNNNVLSPTSLSSSATNLSPKPTATPNKKKTNSSSNDLQQHHQNQSKNNATVKPAASATDLSRNSSSASSLSTNGTTNSTSGTTTESKSSKKLWSVKRKGKHTLKNEVADFGKKQTVTVIGVRWRRTEDEFLTVSPNRSSYSVPQTPIFAESPPPSMPVMRTKKFSQPSHMSTVIQAADDDNDEKVCPAAGVSKQRRFKSLIESPTDDELRQVRTKFRNSCREANNVSPVYEPTVSSQDVSLSGETEPTHPEPQEKRQENGVAIEPSLLRWCGSNLTTVDKAICSSIEVPVSAMEGHTEMLLSPTAVLRNRSHSCDAAAMLTHEEAAMIRASAIQKVAHIRRSSSSGCLPLSPLDEAKDNRPNEKSERLCLATVDTSSLSSIGRKHSSSEDNVMVDHQIGAVSAENNTNNNNNGAQFVLRLSESEETDAGSISSSHSRSRAGSIPQQIESVPVDTRPSSMFTGFWNEKLTLQEMLNDMEAIDEVTATGGACLESSMCSTNTVFTSARDPNTQSMNSNKPAASSSSSISLTAPSSSGIERSSSAGLISQSAFAYSAKFVRAKEYVQRKIGIDYFGNFCSDQFSAAGDVMASPAELPLAYFCTQLNGLEKTHGHVGNIDLDDLGTGFVGRPYNGSTTGKPVHLVVCVHGLEGNCCDLRLVRAYLELLLPDQRFKFLMSTSNQSDTFTDVDRMADNLVHEVQLAYNSTRSRIVRISFIGHSLGTLIIRAALAKPAMIRFRERFHTFLSLSGPHLGTLYSTSSLVNMGIWLIQKWKKSSSLLQLSLRDHADVRQTFLYKLSQKPGLEFFKNVLFVGSHQDHYVPYHSARIELCRVAAKDNSTQGAAYREMVENILRPLADPTSHVVNVARFDCYFSLPSGADNLIGRAAHVAVLDSDLFLEKFFTVIARKYFV